MTIKDLREQWEGGLDPIVVIDLWSEMYVVLEDSNEKSGQYHCHHYFIISGSWNVGAVWNVSADHQGVDAEVVMNWMKQNRDVLAPEKKVK